MIAGDQPTRSPITRLAGLGPTGRRDALWAALLAVAIGCLALLGTFDAAEEATLDLRFQLRGPRQATEGIAIVAIDERSLGSLGQMPWDRRVFARLLDRLREGGAAVVALDVAFSEPGARFSGEDAALGDAIIRFGPVVLAAFRPLESAVSFGPALVQPVSTLRDAAWGVGLAHFSRSADMTVHRAQMQQPAGRALVPTLGLAAARAYAGAAGAPAPVAPDEIVLDFVGPPGQIPAFSAIDVLGRPEIARRLAGRIAFIGATAAGLPDTGFRGGFPGPYSGVELHATVAENALAPRRGLRGPGPLGGGVALVLVLLASWALAATATRPAWRLGLLGGSLAGLGGAAHGVFAAGVWLPVVAPAALLAASALAGILRQEHELLRERARLLGWYAQELAREATRARERIDGELHDEAQQLLVVMEREARKLEKALGTGALGQLPGLISRTREEIVRVRKALVPPALRMHGLRVAAEEMVREAVVRAAPVRVELEDDGWPEGVDRVIGYELYWLVKEALNNALKHSAATKVVVRLGAMGSRARVEISDDGRGFAVPPLERPPETHEHTGLHRMWIRARGLGGRLQVRSAPGSGTSVVFEIPLRKMADAAVGQAAHP